MFKRLSKLFIIFVICYTGVLGYIFINQRDLQYHPNKEIAEISTYGLEDTKEVFLTSADGAKIQTWVHMPKPGMPMTVFYHGNAHHLGQRAAKFKKLISLGYGFIAPSWHGFGKSEGLPGEEEIYADADAAIQYLQQLGYKTEDTILIGESLGSGIATRMATKHRFKGLFLITPYTRISDRAQEIYYYLPVKYLTKDDYSNIDYIDKVDNIPVFMVHGDRDDIIPHTHSERVFAKALEPKKLVIYPGKGHSDYDVDQVFDEMDRFLNHKGIVNNETKSEE